MRLERAAKDRSDVKKLNIFFSLFAVAVMIIIWVIAYYSVRNDYVIPSLGETFREIGRQLISADFWVAFGNTFSRSLAAWALAFVLAVIFASLSAVSRVFYSFFAPFISVLRTIPTMAITLMLLIWSSPRMAPIIVSFLMIFPLTYAQLIAAYRGIDVQYVEMAKIYRVSLRDKLFRIYIPLMLPDVLSQIGANFSLTLKVMVSAEVLSSTFRSVGGLIHDAANYLQIAQMFAVVILMLLIGGVLEFAFGKFTLITDRWTRGRNR